MKKILFITTSPTVNGNGDTLIETAINAARSVRPETEIKKIDTRGMSIGGCKACNECMKTGSCVQKDDFEEILSAVRDSDSIVVTVPIYFNLPCAQSVALLDRFFTLFSPEYKGSGKNKKLAILLTFGGSDPEKIKTITTDAISFFNQVKECRVELFPKLSAGPDVCRNTPAYLEKAAEIGKWTVE